MNHIWSPWRMNYIMNHERVADCVFCKAAGEQNDPENLVVYRGQAAFVILNRFPYTSGHLMIVPFTHAASLDELPTTTQAEMMALATRSVQVLREVYNPEGFNLGINLGEAAGAGIADHLHLHVVPRWNGDTNFMSAVGGTRVLPENLQDSYTRITQHWNR